MILFIDFYLGVLDVAGVLNQIHLISQFLDGINDAQNVSGTVVQ